MHKKKNPFVLYLTLFIFFTDLLPFLAEAQLRKSLAKDETFYSDILPNLGKSKWLVRYRVILPKNYRSEETHSVVYFLHGRNGDRFTLETLGILDRLDKWSIEKRKILPFIFIQPECGNCYWMNAALKNERWGEVITQELIADVENKFKVYHEPSRRLLAGISMGGHGAIQLALNFPNTYGAIAAHSPVFRTQEEASREFYERFGVGDDFQNRDPFSLILFKGKTLNLPIWIDIGRLDFAFNNTNNFANLLRKIGYKGELHIGEDQIGAHSNKYWSYHLDSYLEWYSRNFLDWFVTPLNPQ